MHSLSVPSIAVAGSPERFPVRRIWCVGQNYADHAREMGGDPARNPPFFFAKPADAVVASGATIPYPPGTEQLDHEVELVLALGEGGRVWGAAVGLDLTRRDLQRDLKAQGRPWELAKGFDRSAPIGPLRPGPAPGAGAIRCRLDDALRQDGDLADMIWNADELLDRLGRFVELAAGDLVFTGTPAGVGPIAPGQRVTGEIDGLAPVEVTVGPPAT